MSWVFRVADSRQQTADSRLQTADSRQLNNDFVHYTNILTRNMRSLYRSVGHIALIPVFALGCTIIHWTALRLGGVLTDPNYNYW